jgi:hypothetical protein
LVGEVGQDQSVEEEGIHFTGLLLGHDHRTRLMS